jgi:hypothetical protein
VKYGLPISNERRVLPSGVCGMATSWPPTATLAAAGILSIEVQNSPGVDVNSPAAEPVA